MPFVSSVEGTFGYGRGLVIPNNYYTSSSGYYMATKASGAISLSIADLSGTSVIRTYSGITNISRTFVHDKDLNSNIYYTIFSSGTGTVSERVYKNVVPKGGTAVTQTLFATLYLVSDASTLGGKCYVTNAVNPSSFGGLLSASGAGINSRIYSVYLNSNKTDVSSANVFMNGPRGGPPYYTYVGVDVVPKLYSGFVNNHIIYMYGNLSTVLFIGNNTILFNSDGNKSNIYNISTTIGVNAPAVTYSIIYYPPNKPIFTGDNISLNMNRVVIFDNNSPTAYEWQIEESGSSLTWTFLRKLVTGIPTLPANRNVYPYSMSTEAYQSIA